MDFYERYAAVCELKGLKPCSQKTADIIGCTKAAISVWKNKHFMPQGNVIYKVAVGLNVSADYLLGLSSSMTVDKVASAGVPARVADLYNSLDDADRAKLEAYAEGLLANDKYRTGKRISSAS